MELSRLLEGMTYEVVRGTIDQEITQICYDSRKVTKDCLFLCIVGATVNGHLYAKSAVEQGAKVLVISQDVVLQEEQEIEEVTIIWVANTRIALAYLSAAYFHHPANELQVIGVTGTKGKTTTTYCIKSILEQAGYEVGLIGTIEVMIGKRQIPATNTTPESYEVQQYFREMVNVGCKYVVMEVSSQGLMLDRTLGFTFDIGVFTNLSPDHIGEKEHTSYEQYVDCKKKLFRQCKVGIFNNDDLESSKLMEGATCEIHTYGIKEGDLRGEQIARVTREATLGMLFHTTGSTNIEAYVPMPGRFSVYNALAAMSVCKQLCISEQAIVLGLSKVRVRGRMEPITMSSYYKVFIDYAHNAMALESLLITLRAYKPKRLICLFGCGGNRSKCRRYEMGEVAGRLADYTILTSDNPREEEPDKIIEDIIIGIKKTIGSYTVITDRIEAIQYAMSHARVGDIIVLAGKGHEQYQEIKGIKYPLDERTIVRELRTKQG